MSSHRRITEIKSVSTDSYTDFWASGQSLIVPINLIALGSNLFNRVGRFVNPKTINYRLFLTNAGIYEHAVRVLLVYDRSHNSSGSPVSIPDIVTGYKFDGSTVANVWTYPNPTTTLRYEILDDKFFCIYQSTLYGSQKTLEGSVSVEGYQVEYSGPTAAYTSVSTGLFYLIVFTDSLATPASAGTRIYYQTLFTYTD